MLIYTVKKNIFKVVNGGYALQLHLLSGKKTKWQCCCWTWILYFIKFICITLHNTQCFPAPLYILCQVHTYSVCSAYFFRAHVNRFARSHCSLMRSGNAFQE